MKSSNTLISVDPSYIHSKMYNTILGIGREDLEPRAAAKSLDLTGPLSSRSPTLAPGPNASVQPGFVYEHQLIRTKGQYFMYIFVSQIWVALSCDVLCDFLRPLRILQGSAYAKTCPSTSNSFLKKSSHIAETHARIDGKLVV